MRSAFRIRLLSIPGLGGVVPAGIAVILWSLAPVLATLARHVPPLQLTALCVAVAAATTWPVARFTGTRATDRIAVPRRIWLSAPVLIIGAIGFYFLALRLAPPAEAALVTYTWPVLFVISAELAYARRVRPPSITGAALAFGGAGLVLMPSGGAGPGVPWSGYAAAFASGSSWAMFSLLARRQSVPLTGIMPRLFGLAAAWAAAGHLLLETALWPVPPDMALTIVLIGAGPYGLAFLAWDTALRRGRSTTVGTLAYAVPVLSAVLLVATGMAAADWRLPTAAFAVVGGCIVASCPERPRRPASEAARTS